MQITCELKSYECGEDIFALRAKSNIKMCLSKTMTGYVELCIGDDKHLVSLSQLCAAVNSIDSCYASCYARY